MNRILSIESSRGCAGDSAFITKRLCISVLLAIAFLALLGGYLFGRLTTEREFRMKAQRAPLQVTFRQQYYKRQEIERLVNSIDELLNLTHNASKNIQESTGVFSEFRRLLICERLSSAESNRNQLVDYTNDIITSKLQLFIQCLDEASKLVRI